LLDANAGVSFAGISMWVLSEHLTVGIAERHLLGKLVGVLGTVAVLVKLSVADLPAQASPPFPILLNSALALLPISEASACERGGGLI
jgi:Na+/H+ antiporter NhaA